MIMQIILSSYMPRSFDDYLEAELCISEFLPILIFYIILF